MPAAPLRIFFDAEPTFFLQKIQEDDLPQKFFGKLLRKFFIRKSFIGLNQSQHLQIFFLVNVEEFLRNALNAEGFFQLGKARQMRIVIKNREKLLTRRHARFVFADKERTTPRRSNFYVNFILQEGKIDFYEGKPPFIGRGIGIKGGNGSADIIAHYRFNKISLDGTGAVDGFIFVEIYRDHNNFFAAALIISDKKIVFDVFGEVIGRILRQIGRDKFHSAKKFICEVAKILMAIFFRQNILENRLFTQISITP